MRFDRFWYGLVTFALGLHIPENELELCRKLTAPAWISVALQNDLWSWPKERDAAEKLGQTHVINALWVLMQKRQVGIEAAEEICRELIKQYVVEYRKIWEENQFNESISLDLRKYMECMLYSISGNVVWSLGCPRYNLGIDFNEKQLDWMRNGLPAAGDPVHASSADDSSDSCTTLATSDSEVNESVSTAPPEGPLDGESKGSYQANPLKDSLQLQQEVSTSIPPPPRLVLTLGTEKSGGGAL